MTRLAYFEVFDDIHAAVAREKQIKSRRREKKEHLIAVNAGRLDPALGRLPMTRSRSRVAGAPRRSPGMTGKHATLATAMSDEGRRAWRGSNFVLTHGYDAASSGRMHFASRVTSPCVSRPRRSCHPGARVALRRRPSS